MRLGWSVFVVALTASQTAFGAPSLWDKAKDPAQQRAHQTLVSAERMMLRADESGAFLLMRKNFKRATLAMLRLAGARALPDVRLRFLMGELLADEAGQDREAVALLRQALAEAPESPLAARAWFNIAISEARQGRRSQESEAYGRALELTWEKDFRANILLNRGEALMGRQKLEASIKDYRKAILLAQHPELVALAHFGLGVALERHGDFPAALAALNIARRVVLPGVPSALDLPSVFFVPSYDIYYYKALTQMAIAHSVSSKVLKQEAYRRALGRWNVYLLEARADKQPWVKHAELHHKTCRERLNELGFAKRK